MGNRVGKGKHYCSLLSRVGFSSEQKKKQTLTHLLYNHDMQFRSLKSYRMAGVAQWIEHQPAN